MRSFEGMEPDQPPQHAGHTRPLEPSSPTIGDRPRKTQRKKDLPPVVIPYGEAQRTTNTVASTLLQGIEATVTESRRVEEILKDFATEFDAFSATYKTQRDQYIADEISKTVGAALIEYYQQKFGTARAIKPPQAPHAPRPSSYAEKVKSNNSQPQVPRNAAKNVPTKTSQVSREEKRVLVVLSQNALLRREGTYILKRRLLSEVPGLLPASVTSITPTSTGWAIHLADLASRDALVSDTNLPRVLKSFDGVQAFIPEHWFNYAVTNVPISFTSIVPNMEAIEVTPQLVAEEVLTTTGESPVRCTMSRHGVNPMTRRATWIISFKKEMRSFRLFSPECTSHFIERRPKITHHSNGCQGWCNPLKCYRAARCNNCGDLVDSHQDGPMNAQCTRATRCAMCHGPHKAGEDKCPARPRSWQGRIVRPSKEQLRGIRAASALVANAAARTRTTSPEDPTNGGCPASPSPIPNPRKRGGAAVTAHEGGATASQAPRPSRIPSQSQSSVPTQTARPDRQAKPQGSLNYVQIRNRSESRAHATPQSSQASQASTNSTNRFTPLSSPEDGSMELDTPSNSQ